MNISLSTSTVSCLSIPLPIKFPIATSDPLWTTQSCTLPLNATFSCLFPLSPMHISCPLHGRFSCLYLANLYSLGSNLEDVSFLILKDQVRTPHQRSPDAQDPAERLSLWIASLPFFSLLSPTAGNTHLYLVYHCLPDPVCGICWIKEVFVYRW